MNQAMAVSEPADQAVTSALSSRGTVGDEAVSAVEAPETTNDASEDFMKDIEKVDDSAYREKETAVSIITLACPDVPGFSGTAKMRSLPKL